MTIHFAKYEGAGNDFVMIDNRAGAFEPDTETVAALCDRRFGIGADGLILLENDPQAQLRMRYFNADGGEATMCGNGGRCIALFAHHLGIGGRRKEFTAADGMHSAEILSSEGACGVVALQMIDVAGVESVGSGYVVDTGSPHYVEFADDVDRVDVVNRGRQLRHSPEFARWGGVNVNFVQRTGENSIRIRTYERGVEDETLACGTGATAAAIVTGYLDRHDIRRFNVSALGGLLGVEYEPLEGNKYGSVVLTGPARRVFDGEFITDNF